MNGLLGPGSQPNLFYKRKLKQSDYRTVPHKYYYVLSLHLAGKSAQEIAELADYSLQTIYAILKKDEIIALRQQMLEGVQLEFEVLYKRVVEVLKTKLDSLDETIQMQAVNSFFREKGRLDGVGTQFNITAEDVVIQILNQYGNEEAG